MAEIKVAPDELRQHQSAVSSQAQEVQSAFTSLKARLEPLRSQFSGQAATAFDGRWEEWHTSARGLIEALDGLGQFLKSCADVIEQTDTQLAQGLKG